MSDPVGRPDTYGLDLERGLTDAELAQRAGGEPWPGQPAAVAEIERRRVEAAARTTPAAAARSDAAGSLRFAQMDKPSDAEIKVAAGKQAVVDALALHPFRAVPSWADLHIAVEAVIRFLTGTPAVVPEKNDAAPRDPVIDAPPPAAPLDPYVGQQVYAGQQLAAGPSLSDAARASAPYSFAGELNGAVIAAGAAARASNLPREVPATLTSLDQTAWFRGWDDTDASIAHAAANDQNTPPPPAA